MALATTAQENQWDTADIIIQLDGMSLDLPSNGDLFTAAWATDNVTLTVDVWGNGVKVINHDGSANLTLNVSRFSNVWKKVLKDENEYRTGNHNITILTPLERLTTSTAVLTKLPDVGGGNEAPTASPVFRCLNLKAEPVE